MMSLTPRPSAPPARPGPDLTEEAMSLERCHPASPYRAVDWRRRLATCLRRGSLPRLDGWADDPVERAVAFEAALQACGDDPRDPRLVDADPALAHALLIWLDGGPRR